MNVGFQTDRRGGDGDAAEGASCGRAYCSSCQEFAGRRRGEGAKPDETIEELRQGFAVESDGRHEDSDMIHVLGRETAGLTRRRVADVHLEDDELGEMISVHLRVAPSARGCSAATGSVNRISGVEPAASHGTANAADALTVSYDA